MNQRMFDHAVAAVALRTFVNEDVALGAAKELRALYVQDYPRDHFADEVAAAAESVLECLAAVMPDAEKAEGEVLLRAAVRYAERVGPDGKRIRWKLLDGTRFNRAAADPSRATNAVTRIAAFFSLARAGAVPPDWLGG